jgi:hypothetical protein
MLKYYQIQLQKSEKYFGNLMKPIFFRNYTRCFITILHSSGMESFFLKKINKALIFIKALLNSIMDALAYSASATTSFTSGIMRFIMPSIPALSVTMLEGQPLQEPCNIKLTIPSL